MACGLDEAEHPQTRVEAGFGVHGGLFIILSSFICAFNIPISESFKEA